jgi:hypothetical protein
MWSASWPVLGSRAVNTSTIIEGVFYVWSVPKIYGGQQRSFASSRSWEASQGHEAVMRETWGFSVGDGQGKFVVEEELEVDQWRLSVWFEDFMCAVVQ